MMKKHKAEIAVPPLRFKGFEDAWRVKKLGNVFGMALSTNTLSRSCLSDCGVAKNIHYGDVLIKLPSVTDVRTTELPFVADEKFKVGAKNLLRDGDIVMADTAEDETAGKVTEIVGIGDQKVVSGLHTIVLRPNDDFGAGFLGYCLNAKGFHNELLRIMQGVKVLSVNKSSLADCRFFSPSFPEQQKLGETFRSLDALIASRETALEKLQTLKKAMLEKMFPRANAKVPEVRFKGFDGEWEMKQLEKVALFNPCCSLPDDFEYVDLESVIRTEMLSHRTEYRDTAPSRAQRLAQVGDLFYQTVRPYQKNNYLFELETSRPYVFSTGYAQLRPKCDAYFLMSAIQTDDFVATVLQNCTGTSYPAISDTNLSLLDINLPSLSEQRKIGAYFRSLDALISARRDEIAKLKDLKKALLDRMFV